MMNIESVLNNAGLLLKAYAHRRAKQTNRQKPAAVSVIIPVYNAMPHFPACMASLLAQTLDEIELIVVDDGSTDGSGEIADALAEAYDNITAIHRMNSGVSASRNAGIAAAKGEYIAFADADDIAEPDLYERLYTYAAASSADIVSSGYLLGTGGPAPDVVFPPPFEPGRVFLNEDMLRFAAGMHNSGCFLYIWRNLFLRCLIIDNNILFDEEISIGEDTLFNMECFLKAEKSAAIDYAGYHYRINPAGAMQKKYKPLLNGSLQKQFGKKLELCKKYFPDYYDKFCRDMAKYNITALFPLMLANVYQNDLTQKKEKLIELINTDMMQKAFEDFNLAQIRSRSLDWRMFWFAKNKCYFAAHLICKYVLYKK